MTTTDFLEHILRSLDEIVFPALGAYALYLFKSWIERQKGDRR